jgi:hypothetical protein
MTDGNKKAGNVLAALAGLPSSDRTATGGVSMVPSPPPPNIPPPPPSPLEQFFSRPVVQGLYYNGKVIKLDGYKFVGCRFDNCTLMVDSANFEMLDCVIDPSTAVQYGVQALKIVKLFNAHNQWMHANFPMFAPKRNSDGSVNIVGVY